MENMIHRMVFFQIYLYRTQTLITPIILFREDFGVVEHMPSLLDFVKVMQFAISKGRIAIHCHAGKGEFVYLYLYSYSALLPDYYSVLTSQL